jgi:hypothetical protein
MPNVFKRINSTTSMPGMVAQINDNFAKLDRESTTKQFKDNQGNTMLLGNLQDGQFGMSLLDANGSGLFIGLYMENRFAKIAYEDGVPISLDGMAPDDGRIGFWVVEPGQNVITQLGG